MNNMILEDEQCQYINKITENMKQEQITRQKVLEILAFAREVADKSDENILSLIDDVYSIFDNMPDDEWEEVKRRIPFPVSITAEDNTDEVPADEET